MNEYKLYRWELNNPDSLEWGFGVVIAKNKEEAFKLLKEDLTSGHTGCWLKYREDIAELSKDDVKEIELNAPYVHTEVYSL